MIIVNVVYTNIDLEEGAIIIDKGLDRIIKAMFENKGFSLAGTGVEAAKKNSPAKRYLDFEIENLKPE